ncbi:MAG: hypothetical protein FJ207_00795 [Gemmatimonadetes bacterium]|nr:hypothetical protein [Gemmatimonadota bacterium]
MTRLSWLSAAKIALCVLIMAVTAGLARKLEQQSQYPAPRFPSVGLNPPTSVEEVMPYARQAARNRAAAFGGGLGTSTAGETVVLVVGECDNPHILEAIRRALLERQITPVVMIRGEREAILWDYATARASHSEEECTRRSRVPGMSITQAGYTEGAVPGTVPYPRKARNWLRSARPDLFQQVYPDLSLEPEPDPANEAPNLGFTGDRNDVIIAYLERHPEVDGVYSAGTWYQEAGNLGRFASKWRGTAFWDRFTVISNVPAYPADVWTLTEEKNIEAIAFASRFHLTDPEGTDLSDDISPELARRWASGAYERGHNMLGPNMATGRFARSIVSYPAMSGPWIPRSPIATPSGVIAATTNHVGFHPLIKMYYEEGYLTRVEGGGTYGELARTHLCCYPGINTAQYPHYDGKPGFFYLHEIALGTNPKWFRPPDPNMSVTTVNERLKSGYLHIGLGASMEHDPGGARRSEEWQRFTEERNLPFYHGLHLHLYFPTYTLSIRGSNRTVDVIRGGRMTSLDDPEVRALASRYGNPDEILADDWIVEVPGINAPGRFEDYARDPYPTHRDVNDKILNGTYEHFYPPRN